jgi:hypothetical protein
VDVTTTGGEQLVVQFELQDDNIGDVHLQGAARIIYEAELSAEALL